MFRQISMVKLKAGLPPARIEEVVRELTDLGNVVTEVNRAHVARIEDSPICDILFMWEFENREGHQRYQRHPFHGPMDDRIRETFEWIHTVRYDVEPKTTIKYVANMRMKADTPPETLSKIERRLKLLGKTIAEARAWSIGRCLGTEGSSEPWTFTVVADFQDARAYERFQAHPEHEAFRQVIAPHQESTVGMAYEAHYPMLWLLRFEDGIPMPHPRYRLPPLDLPPLERSASE